MTTQEAIRALFKRGYSQRKIALELGIHRNTVGQYLEGATVANPPGDSKCTTPSPGSGSGAVPGVEGIGATVSGEGDSKCTTPSPGSGGVSAGSAGGALSECEPWREVIGSKLGQGLHAKRIWQDLVDAHGFAHGYQSVKRFARKLKAREPKRVWRMECGPGEEAQVDYGTVWVRLGGKRRKIHVLRVTLSHSRKGYTEAMPRQDTESFVRGLENAWRHFGGVPLMLVLDNLKAGVLKPDFYDPELNPKFAACCAHYNVTAMPTRPRTPEHKGKVESNIRYVKESAIRGREFATLAALNAHLRDWERRVADHRVHGTTRKQVGTHFAEIERPVLQPLPPDLFPSFVEQKRSVHRDSYVEFERAYYEAPPEFIGRQLWVRCDGRMVHLFNLQMEQIAVHVKLGAGEFSKVLGCAGMAKSVRESLQLWTRRAAEIDPDLGLWAQGLVSVRKEAGLRALMGLLTQLLPQHGKQALGRACARARLHGQYRLRDLREWLERPDQQQAFSFLSEHEVIREMSDYGKLVGFEQSN